MIIVVISSSSNNSGTDYRLTTSPVIYDLRDIHLYCTCDVLYTAECHEYNPVLV